MFIKSVLLAAFVASASAAPIIKGEPTPPAHTSKLVVSSFSDVERRRSQGECARDRIERASRCLFHPRIGALQRSARPKPVLSCRIP